RAGRGAGERVPDNALDAEGSVAAQLAGDHVPGSDPDRAAVADIGAFRSLAADDEVHLAGVGDGCGDPWYQAGRVQVDVVVELEARAQEQAALEHPARDARVPDATEQDRVVAADGRELLVGEGLAGAVPAGRPEVVRGGADGDVRPRD